MLAFSDNNQADVLKRLTTSWKNGNLNRVKSDNFGHQVNSDIHLQTVEIQMMKRLLMSRLIRIFTGCLVHFFYFS